jgi:galactokinase
VIAARAPGRVNLIGEHTDYNDGFVLPIAIDRFTTVSANIRDDRLVNVAATDLGETDSFSLDSIEATGTWRDYVRGVVRELAPKFGADLSIASTLPLGAGLSSSASLELAVARVFADAEPVVLARAAQRAENDFVGVRCGIMDQLAVAAACGGHAMLLDCRDLSFMQVRVPDDVAIVVCDSHVERRLAASGYNDRRATCEQAARLLGVAALRDATLDAIRELPSPLRARARHVVTENERTLAAGAALEGEDCPGFGELMNESHRSMRDDFGIVPREVDRLAAAVRATPGCYGARLTGGGFGGAVVALVDAGSIAAASESAESAGATVFVCRASDGVTVLDRTNVAGG